MANYCCEQVSKLTSLSDTLTEQLAQVKDELEDLHQFDNTFEELLSLSGKVDDAFQLSEIAVDLARNCNQRMNRLEHGLIALLKSLEDKV